MENIEEAIREWIAGGIQGWYEFIGTIYAFMLKFILYTPIAIIANAEIQRLWWIFVAVGIGVIGILCLLEGILRVFGFSKMNMFQLIGRTAVAFSALAFVLPGMTLGLSVVNKFVAYFISLAHNNMDPAVYFSGTIGSALGSAGLGVFVSVLFMVLFLYYMFKILLAYGRRWFDIMVSAVISPLAFASTIFDRTSGYFNRWWSHVIALYLVQVVHAAYICVLGLIILAPNILGDTVSAFAKILLMIGALWRMSTPPAFVSSMSGTPDSRNMLRDITRAVAKFKGVKKK